MVHLRRAVDGQLADELDALGVKVVDGRDFALLLVEDAARARRPPWPAGL